MDYDRWMPYPAVMSFVARSMAEHGTRAPANRSITLHHVAETACRVRSAVRRRKPRWLTTCCGDCHFISVHTSATCDTQPSSEWYAHALLPPIVIPQLSVDPPPASSPPRVVPLRRPTSFLHTGDLGRVDSEGRIFISGRIKDLIIVRGRNLYPQVKERPSMPACRVFLMTEPPLLAARIQVVGTLYDPSLRPRSPLQAAPSQNTLTDRCVWCGLHTEASL